MTNQNQVVAEQATFRSFANSYLREMDPGIPVFHRVDGTNVDCVELTLPTRNTVLRIELKSRSLCGMHLFGRIWQRGRTEPAWREIEPIAVCYLLIQAAGDSMRRSGEQRHSELELFERVLQSYQATKRYLDATAGSPQSGFIGGEQSLYFGHPLHPTPKSLQGMTSWQQVAYAPELRGDFQLTYFAAKAEIVRQDSADVPTRSIVESLLGEEIGKFALTDDEALIPMHPLQAEALMLTPNVRALCASGALRHLGPAGPRFMATSSVRTVFSPDAAWMPKFSLPVRITNSQRLNRKHELDAGVAVARLFARAGMNDLDPRLGFLHDSAYVTLEMPGQDESGFEVIFRENPLRDGFEETTITVSALTAEPLPGEKSRLESLVRRVAREQDVLPREACRRWFEAYLDCALDPLVRLYDKFGVALEAHQQNSLLDISQGLPRKYFYRDSQGFYLSNNFKARWCTLLPELTQTRELFFDDREIRERFSYYLIVNQIFSVIARAGHDGLTREADLIAILRLRLAKLARELSGGGRDFASGLLNRPSITAKANLAIRLKNVDELAAGGHTLYTQIPNPLSGGGLALVTEAAHALAS
ncbi:IucA/IucC family protein [Mesorhizobium sp. SB112]|uniref:IucA/IucC family protein n=1 Tax=Mesorhizobium sp. SB112 TaxID=3151853 RepID=UPI0032671C8D